MYRVRGFISLPRPSPSWLTGRSSRDEGRKEEGSREAGRGLRCGWNWALLALKTPGNTREPRYPLGMLRDSCRGGSRTIRNARDGLQVCKAITYLLYYSPVLSSLTPSPTVSCLLLWPGRACSTPPAALCPCPPAQHVSTSLPDNPALRRLLGSPTPLPVAKSARVQN